MDVKRTNSPDYWALLSPSDQLEYKQLKKAIEPLCLRASRDQLPLKFQIMVGQIQRFVIRRTDEDWKRSLVCGILWIEDAIAVSTRQLSILMGKCKSSINCGFQSIGYGTVTMSSTHAAELSRAFPTLGRSSGEIRQWTIRARVPACPIHLLGMQVQPVWASEERPKEEGIQQIRLIEESMGFAAEEDDFLFQCQDGGFGEVDGFAVALGYDV
jgi:hypothetical protein